MTILINGVQHRWTRHRIKFHHCCFLVDPIIPGKDQHAVEISWSIKKEKQVDCGFLLPGSSVKVGQGMEFVVAKKDSVK